ncbi:YceD family protein [Pullulanibacillus sp. KACC 23026]|uniref:YceD family protein n=1 Tax=Pullulanibacillus sp. KACC 23026 TaxID=3028315 RepID=UPI0023AE7877|nr:YceD family protein [Pullulanibacillus sp. KACC 23026]WEG11679.1 YceD family protein [Pullulanibacillus sp. KACC 23026]
MTLKWTVPELVKYRNDGLMIDETLSLQEDLTNRDREIRQVSPVNVSGYAEISRSKASFYLTVKGEMVLPCSITLEDVPFPFHIQMSDTFHWDASFSEEDHVDEETHEVVDQTIDLVPYIEEAILVEKPIRVISEKAKELPLPSGKGWDFVADGNRKQQLDPRLAKLKELLDD